MYYSLLCFCFEIATFATLPALPPLFSRFGLAGLHMPSDGASRRRRTGAKQRYGDLRRLRWTRAVGGNRSRDPSPTCCGAFGLEWFFLLNRWIFQKKKSCNHQKMMMMMMMMMNFRSAQLPNHQKIYTSHKKHNTYKKCSNSSLLA